MMACRAIVMDASPHPELQSLRDWAMTWTTKTRRTRTLRRMPRRRPRTTTTTRWTRRASPWWSTRTTTKKRCVCVDFMAGIMRCGTLIARSILDAVASQIHGSSFPPASDRGPGSIGGSLGPGRPQPFGGAVRALEPSNGITSSCNFELPAHMHSVSFHRLSHFRPPTNYAAFGQTLAPLRPGITASRLPLLAMAKQDTKPAKRAKKAEEAPARKSKASAAAEGKVPEWVCSHGSRCREMCGVDFFWEVEQF